MFSSLGSISNESSSIHLHAPTPAPSTVSISGLVSAKEIVNALVSIKIRMVFIDYIVAEKVCLGDDDKALVGFGQSVLWKILLQTIFLSGQKRFAPNTRCMSTEIS